MNAQGTSFIPQRPTNGKTATRRTRKIYVLAYLSYVLFFGSLLAAGGVFFFNFSLDVQLEKQQQALAAERDQFNQGDIESIRDLEKRINIAQERLDNHLSVLTIFDALEQNAVQSIYFTGFTYKRQGDDFPLVTFTGDSSRFSNILFQRQIFANNPILAGSEFKEVTLQTVVDDNSQNGQNESIEFTLEKEVDTSLIGYSPRGITNVQPAIDPVTGQPTAPQQTQENTEENTGENNGEPQEGEGNTEENNNSDTPQ